MNNFVTDGEDVLGERRRTAHPTIELREAGDFQELVPPATSPAPPPLLESDAFAYPAWVPAWHAKTAPVHALGCYTVENATLFPGGLVSAEGALFATPEVVPAYICDHLLPGGTFDVELRRTVTGSLSNPALAVHDYSFRTWGHWLVDTLPRIEVARRTLGRRFKALNIVLPAETKQWAYQLLEYLYPRITRQVVLHDFTAGPVKLARAIIPTVPHAGYFYHPLATELHSGAITRSHGRTRFRRLFISRRHAEKQGRVMTNRGRVEQIARKLGFEIFCPEQHPVSEQIGAYQEASAIAGEYGSGLHNSMFAPPGECVVVGLAPTQLLQSRLSALTQHPTGYIYPEHSVQHDWRTIYGVAEQDVELGLEAAISSIPAPNLRDRRDRLTTQRAGR